MKLTANQKKWLSSATPEQLRAFLAKGPAETEMVFDPLKNTIKYTPSLRGVRIDTEDYFTAEAAMAAAESHQHQLNIQQPLMEIDEFELNISNNHLSLFEAFEESSLRTESLIHIATILSAGPDCLPGSFTEFLDELDDHTVKSISPTLPFIGEIERVLTSDSHEEAAAFFFELALSHEKLGYLAKIATPIRNHSSNGVTSLSWGHYMTTWVYAETLEELASEAGRWLGQYEKSLREEAHA